MKKLLVAAVAFLAFTGTAHATFLDIQLGNADNVVNFNLNPGSIAGTPVDLNAYVLSGNLTLSGAAQIVTGSLANQYLAPTGIVNPYLAVVHSPGTSGTATFTLPGGQHAFGALWGSIDPGTTRNVAVLTDSLGHSFTITGQMVLDALVANGISVIPSTTDFSVAFTSGFGTIATATLTASQNSFEIASFETAATPLPAALPLFAAALLAMAFVAYRRKMQQKI